MITFFQKFIGPLLFKFPVISGILSNADTVEYVALFSQYVTLLHQSVNPTESLMLDNPLPDLAYCFITLPVLLGLSFWATYYYDLYKKRIAEGLTAGIWLLIFFSVFMLQRVNDFINHDWSVVGFYPTSILLSNIMIFLISIFYISTWYRLHKIKH